MRCSRIPRLLILALGVSWARAEKPAAERAVVAASRAVEAEDVASRTRRETGGRRPVFWLGLDGLDFELLDRLAAEGRMPNWKRLASEGFTARLRSFAPLISPILWTTAATGVGPEVGAFAAFLREPTLAALPS